MDKCFKCGCYSAEDVEDSCPWCGEPLYLCANCRGELPEELLATVREAWRDSHPCFMLRFTLEDMKHYIDGLHEVRVALYQRHELEAASEDVSKALRQLEDVFSELKPLGGLS